MPITSILFEIVTICRSLFNWYYLEKKSLSQLLVPFLEFSACIKYLQKKKIVIANVFPELQNVYNLVKPHSKKRRYKTSFEITHVKAFETLVKSTWEHFYYISSSLWGNMTSEISPLVKFKILGLFVHTFTADHKYPVRDCENLLIPV